MSQPIPLACLITHDSKACAAQTFPPAIWHWDASLCITTYPINPKTFYIHPWWPVGGNRQYLWGHTCCSDGYQGPYCQQYLWWYYCAPCTYAPFMWWLCICEYVKNVVLIENQRVYIVKSHSESDPVGEKGCAETLMRIHPWRNSKNIWMWWPSWSREGWSRWSSEIPYNLYHSVILSQMV